MDNANNEFPLIDIENQNMNTSLEFFEIIKETAGDYCQYFKKYKEITGIYFEKLSKLTYNKKEIKIKNKNIIISPIFSILNKFPQLVDQQVKVLKNFLNSFELSIKPLEEVLKNELNLLEGPKKSFDENRKRYLKNKLKHKKLMDILSSLEKKIIKYQLTKKEKKDNKDNKDLKENLNTSLNEAKNTEKDFLNKTKDGENYHQIFQEETLKNIDIIKTRARIILENLNNNIIFFLSYFKELYSNSCSIIEKEIEKNKINPINMQDLINNNMILKIYKSEELPSDKYNIKLLDKSELDQLSFSLDDLNEKDLKKNDNFSFFKNKNSNSKDVDDIFSKLNRIDVLEIVKELYNNFNLINKNKYDINSEEEKIEFKNLADKLLLMKKFQKKEKGNEEKITDEEKEKLFLLIQKRENRILFLRRLNKIRTFGNFEYNKNVFDDIIKIFLNMLDKIQIEKDIFSFQFSIILSQTFYIIENEDKKYIFKYIKSHPVYHSEEMWRKTVDYFIQKEIKKYNELRNNLSIKKSNSNNTINELIFAQLIANTNNMVEFDLDLNITEKIIMEYIDKFNINETSKIILLNIIENKKNKCTNNINEKEYDVNNNNKEGNNNNKKENNNSKEENSVNKEENNIDIEENSVNKEENNINTEGNNKNTEENNINKEEKNKNTEENNINKEGNNNNYIEGKNNNNIEEKNISNNIDERNNNNNIDEKNITNKTDEKNINNNIDEKNIINNIDEKNNKE